MIESNPQETDWTPPISLEKLLEELEKNSPMYVGEISLIRVRAFLDGFVMGCMGYVNDEWLRWRQFTDWLRCKFRGPVGVGWPHALSKKYPEDKEAIQQLYPLYQEFLKKQTKKTAKSEG